MNPDNSTKLKSNKVRTVFLIVCALMALAVAIFTPGSLRRWIHEALMQSVTSAHYEILWPPKTRPAAVMLQFAIERESLFTALDRKLDDAASNRQIRVVFDAGNSSGIR